MGGKDAGLFQAFSLAANIEEAKDSLLRAKAFMPHDERVGEALEALER